MKFKRNKEGFIDLNRTKFTTGDGEILKSDGKKEYGNIEERKKFNYLY